MQTAAHVGDCESDGDFLFNDVLCAFRLPRLQCGHVDLAPCHARSDDDWGRVVQWLLERRELVRSLALRGTGVARASCGARALVTTTVERLYALERLDARDCGLPAREAERVLQGFAKLPKPGRKAHENEAACELNMGGNEIDDAAFLRVARALPAALPGVSKVCLSDTRTGDACTSELVRLFPNARQLLLCNTDFRGERANELVAGCARPRAPARARARPHAPAIARARLRRTAGAAAGCRTCVAWDWTARA